MPGRCIYVRSSLEFIQDSRDFRRSPEEAAKKVEGFRVECVRRVKELHNPAFKPLST